MEFQAESLVVGNFQIRYYGIIIVAAMLVAATVAAGLAKRRGLDPDHVWGGLTWAIFPGIVLARLWFVFFPPISLTAGCGNPGSTMVCMDTAWFFENFFNLNNGAIAIWSGGLSIFGAVLGGLLGAWLYVSPLHNRVARIFWMIFYPVTLVFSFIFWLPIGLWKRLRGSSESFKLPTFTTDFPEQGLGFAPWLDIAAVALPLAQFIGRWANYVNQELYGLPTNLPWGITIDADKRVGEFASPIEYPADTLFHPLFLYEALWSLLAFFVLLNLHNRFRSRFLEGDFFLLYLMQYSFIRFLLEFLRVEVAYLPGTTINSSQAMTLVVFGVALLAFWWRGRGGGRNLTAAESPA